MKSYVLSAMILAAGGSVITAYVPNLVPAALADEASVVDAIEVELPGNEAPSVDEMELPGNETSLVDEIEVELPDIETTITPEEVLQAQETWGEAIVAIGEAYLNGEDYEAVAINTVDTLYAYDEGDVLFKPTKAASQQFRSSEEDAISYFVSGNIEEDTGFAIQPWSQVRFETSDIIVDTDSAIAMGNYFFTDANSGDEVKVEFTFGYQKNDDGELLINLHHSSLPYSPAE